MMDLSDITEIGNAYYLIQAIDREPEKIPALAEVKDNVHQRRKKGPAENRGGKRSGTIP